nr:MAG TPA: restriction enzyme [Caudoviricetes sp.]
MSRLDGVDSGAVKSCGCRHSLTSSQNVKVMLDKRPDICYDLSILNKKFNTLTPICPTIFRDEDGNVIWYCKCDCGGHKFTTKTNLVSGHVKYCDKCSRIRKAMPYVGQKFGKLKIIELTNNRSVNGAVVCKVKCDCGNIKEIPLSFMTRKRNFVRSCGKCKFSSGEECVKNCLIDMNIDFKSEYIFKECKNPKTNMYLRFDFYLPNYNTCIEYDGEQHFKECKLCKDSLKDRQYRDNIKNEFCKNNNINLIRISYLDYNKIDTDYLRKALKINVK